MEFQRIIKKKSLYLILAALLFVMAYFYMQNIDLTSAVSNEIEDESDVTAENIFAEIDETLYNKMYADAILEFKSDAKYFEEKQKRIEKLNFFSAMISMGDYKEKFPEEYLEIFGEGYIEKLAAENPEYFAEYESSKEHINADELHIEIVVAEEILRQWDYVSGYHETMETVQKNAESMLNFPAFSKDGSFAKNNIISTAKDFKKLENIQPKMINSKAAQSMVNFNLADYFVIVFLIYIIFCFLEERKSGLWSTVHSTVGGRTKLTARRIGILFVFSLIAAVLFYGTTLILATVKYGAISDFFAPIQSIEAFSKCLLNVNVLSFLLIFILLKAVVIFVIVMSVWAILSMINQVVLGIIVSAVFVYIQYVLYAFLWPRSSISVLKYINFFSLLDMRKNLTVYMNLDFFATPINLLLFELVTLLVLFAAVIFALVLISKKKKPFGKSLKQPAFLRDFSKKMSLKFSYANMFWMEAYKIFIVQKGFLVPLAMLVLFFALPKEETIIYSDVQTFENAFYQTFYGVLDDKKTEQLSSFLSNEKIDGQSSESVQKAMLGLKTQVEYLENVRDEKNIDVWIINPRGFKVLFSESNTNFMRNNTLYVIVFLVILTAGINSYENQSGMKTSLKTTKNGRKKLAFMKRSLNFGCIVVISVVMDAYSMLYIARTYGLSGFSAPLQSLSAFEKFPVNISIFTFIILLFVLKIIVLFLISLIIMKISSVSKTHKQSIIYSAVLLIVPSALFVSGLDVLKPFSAIYYANPVELIKLFL